MATEKQLYRRGRGGTAGARPLPNVNIMIMTVWYSFFPSWTDSRYLFLFLLKIAGKPQRSSCVRLECTVPARGGGTAGACPLPNVDVTRSRSFSIADDSHSSQFISDKVAGRVCVFLTPQSVDSWYMYQHIHTYTNIRKPFLFSFLSRWTWNSCKFTFSSFVGYFSKEFLIEPHTE